MGRAKPFGAEAALLPGARDPQLPPPQQTQVTQQQEEQVPAGSGPAKAIEGEMG